MDKSYAFKLGIQPSSGNRFHNPFLIRRAAPPHRPNEMNEFAFNRAESNKVMFALSAFVLIIFFEFGNMLPCGVGGQKKNMPEEAVAALHDEPLAFNRRSAFMNPGI